MRTRMTLDEMVQYRHRLRENETDLYCLLGESKSPQRSRRLLTNAINVSRRHVCTEMAIRSGHPEDFNLLMHAPMLPCGINEFEPGHPFETMPLYELQALWEAKLDLPELPREKLPSKGLGWLPLLKNCGGLGWWRVEAVDFQVLSPKRGPGGLGTYATATRRIYNDRYSWTVEVLLVHTGLDWVQIVTPPWIGSRLVAGAFQWEEW